jgi:hypothetical protein
MGTAAGFFGITYQGSVNGLASLTLSVFNMVRAARSAPHAKRCSRATVCPWCQPLLFGTRAASAGWQTGEMLTLLPAWPSQDHPDDRAWLKHVFDFVAPSGTLAKSQVDDLLRCFYRMRAEGPTASGAYLHSFPEDEKKFVEGLFSGDGPGATITFATLIDALMAAQADFAEPAAPLEYGSNLVMRNDLTKHTRKVLDPQQQFRKPMTTSQEVGWELLTAVGPPEDPVGAPFRLRTSATTQFADAMEKQTWGRSIGGEFSAYAARKLAEFGGLGMGV